MTPVSVTRVFDFDPESFEQALYRTAEAQNEEKHHFLAVVTAQAALEAVAQSVFTTLFGINLQRSLQTMNELLPDRSFMAKGTKMLWQELTGESVTKQAFWKRYVKHVERRNPAAHARSSASRPANRSASRTPRRASRPRGR